MSKFHERLAALGFADYAAYLESDHWQDFRDSYFASDRPKVCAVCGLKRIQLHHITYVRLGNERLDDVRPLCRMHHEGVHEELKTNHRPLWDTTEIIREMRVALGFCDPLPKKDQKGKKSRSEKSPMNRCVLCGGCAKKGTPTCRPCKRKTRTTPKPTYQQNGILVASLVKKAFVREQPPKTIVRRIIPKCTRCRVNSPKKGMPHCRPCEKKIDREVRLKH